MGLAISGYQLLGAVTIVFVAFFPLPRCLRAGIFTMPEYQEYRYNKSARGIMAFYMMVIYVAIQGIAQDYVTLLVGIPLLLVELYFFRKGSLSGKFLLTGTLLYFMLTYLFYLAIFSCRTQERENIIQQPMSINYLLCY